MIHVLNRGKFKSSKNILDLIFLINIRWECFMGIGLTKAGFSTKSCASDSELIFLSPSVPLTSYRYSELCLNKGVEFHGQPSLVLYLLHHF